MRPCLSCILHQFADNYPLLYRVTVDTRQHCTDNAEGEWGAFGDSDVPQVTSL